MAKVPGKRQIFKIDDETDTVRNITTFLTSISANFPLNSEESQTVGDNSVERTVTLADGQLTLEGFFEKTADGYYDALTEAYTALRDGTITSLSWQYFPESETTGDPKINGECVIQSLTIGGEVAGLVTFSTTLDVSGDVTFGVVP